MQKKLITIFKNIVINRYWYVFIISIISLFVIAKKIVDLKSKNQFTNLLFNNLYLDEDYNEIIEDFGNNYDIILLAKGQRKDLIEFASFIKPRLEEFDELVLNVQFKKSEEFYRKNFLKLFSITELEKFNKLYQNPNLVPFLNNLNNLLSILINENIDDNIAFSNDPSLYNILDGVKLLIDNQLKIMDGHVIDNLGANMVDAITFSENHFFSSSNDFLIIKIKPSFSINEGAFSIYSKMKLIETIIDDISNIYNISYELEGKYAKILTKLETIKYNNIITVITLIGLIILLIFLFRPIVSPILILIILIFNSIYFLGISGLVLNQYNIITLLALIFMIFLSSSFSIQIISSYFEEINGNHYKQSQINRLFNINISSILITGAIMSLLFLSFNFYDSKYISYFGILSCLGVIISTISSILLLPSMIIIFEKFSLRCKAEDDYGNILFNKINIYVRKYKLLIVVIFLLTTIIFIYKIYKSDLNIESINFSQNYLLNDEIDNNLANKFNFIPDVLLFTVDSLIHAEKLTEELRKLPSIGYVESISDYLPNVNNKEARYRFIKNIRDKIKFIELRKQMSSYDIKLFKREMKNLEINIVEIQNHYYPYGNNFDFNKDKLFNKTIELVGLDESLEIEGVLTKFINRMNDELSQIELTYIQQEFSTEYKSRILEMSNTVPLIQNNLPGEIKKQYISKNGDQYLILAYPNNNLWENKTNIKRSLNSFKNINFNLFSDYLYTFNELAILKNEFKSIILISLVLIFLMLLIVFRDIVHALILYLSLLFGSIWLLGMVQVLGVELNFISLVFILILFIIGLDYSINILNSYLVDRDISLSFRYAIKLYFLMSFMFIGFLLFLKNYIDIFNIIALFLVGLMSFLIIIFVLISSFLSSNSN